MAQSYEKAGVNLEAGYEVVRRIKKHVASTSRLGVMGNIGAFGGMFDLSALNVKEPVLVSGTDGVGTKLKLAFEMDKHDTIGVDAVAMCVNDVLAQGAEPLVFLDYVAVGHNEPQKIEAIVSGVADGCRQAGCALVGGETAEMPGMYSEGEYDIAGFTVGVVEKSKLIDGSKVRAGDVLVGIASSGVHSNGFSLVRKILADNCLDLHKVYPELSNKLLGEVLLTPTKIYVKQVLEVIRSCDVHGISHITGGGFDENIPAFCTKDRGSRSRRALGRSCPCSASSRNTARWPTARCSTSSTWASAWSSPSMHRRRGKPSPSLRSRARRRPSSDASRTPRVS